MPVIEAAGRMDERGLTTVAFALCGVGLPRTEAFLQALREAEARRPKRAAGDQNGH